MISDNNWLRIRATFAKGFKSCLHFAVATVNDDGSPNIVPIGALILRDTPSGFYLDKYAAKTRSNLNRDPRVCVLAVNANKLFWGKSLISGRFSIPPAIRLKGIAGELREAKSEEIESWKKRIALARGLKGYNLMWSNMHLVRDLNFDSFEPINIGEMTAGLW